MTPLKGAIHGLIAAGLASMAMHLALARQVEAAEPVVLTKSGFVIYDSQSRAEAIAKALNITPENIDSYKEWFK